MIIELLIFYYLNRGAKLRFFFHILDVEVQNRCNNVFYSV